MGQYEAVQWAMRDNMTWCRNGHYALEATPCANVVCPFKSGQRRLAKPGELVKCGTFQITRPANDWYHAVHVYPEP
jgi:hypothetical protein